MSFISFSNLDRFSTQSADFFSPSNRSRIVAFILKRKMFSEESGDEFSFGIDRLLSEGVYAAAYPLHDVSSVTFCVIILCLVPHSCVI